MSIVFDVHALVETDIRVAAVQRVEAVSPPLLDVKLTVYDKYAYLADGGFLTGIDLFAKC